MGLCGATSGVTVLQLEADKILADTQHRMASISNQDTATLTVT